MLMIAHPAGDAPLPWQCPWVLISKFELAKSVESMNPVRRKNFISWIMVSVASTRVDGMPKAWKTMDAMACAILS